MIGLFCYYKPWNTMVVIYQQFQEFFFISSREGGYTLAHWSDLQYELT